MKKPKRRLVTRAGIIAQAKRMKREIELDLNTIAHWNEHVRKPDEDPIDPDPDGVYASCLAYCNGILNGDVYLAPDHGERPIRRIL
jgi:hypothetical protein